MIILTETARQEALIGALPANFRFSVFDAARAIISQRASAYRSTAAALRELVDNSIEAAASQVHIALEVNQPGRIRIVSAIAVIDNGAGMIPAMLRYALTFGGGTHHNDPSFIGRFGFGLPNASVNQARHIEVFSRTSTDGDTFQAVLDLDRISATGLDVIPEPVVAELPTFVREYMVRHGLEWRRGTVVVWNQPDRLTYKRPAQLKQHLIDDLAVVYRYLIRPAETSLDGVVIAVDGDAVRPVDPLFLRPECDLFAVPEAGGAIPVEDVVLPVRVSAAVDGGPRRLDLFKAVHGDGLGQGEWLSEIRYRIARFPVGFLEDRTRRLAVDSDANRRFDIRRGRRGISFVRSGREIQTVDTFPRGPQDVANGLGRWPLLQSYSYHWGAEVQWAPELDEFFGITNDKQAIRPTEDLWRVLAEAGVPEQLHREIRWQTQQRARSDPAGQHLDRSSTRLRTDPGGLSEHRKAATSRAAASIAVRGATYTIGFADGDGSRVFRALTADDTVQIVVDRNHAFYELSYGQLVGGSGSNSVGGAIDLLLAALVARGLHSNEQSTSSADSDWPIGEFLGGSPLRNKSPRGAIAGEERREPLEAE